MVGYDAIMIKSILFLLTIILAGMCLSMVQLQKQKDNLKCNMKAPFMNKFSEKDSLHVRKYNFLKIGVACEPTWFDIFPQQLLASQGI